MASLVDAGIEGNKIMTTLNLQVAASTDDAGVHWNGSIWVISTTYVNFAVGALEEGAWKSGGGMRFLNVAIPRGATITTAYLTLRSATNNSSSPVYSRIRGEDADDAATFSSASNYINRPRTSASINWDNIPAWTDGVWYNSPEIKTVIQEIVNRWGWASGHDLVIFWDDHDYRTSVGKARVARTWNYYTGDAPKLHIEYTLNPPAAPTNVQATDGTYADKVRITWTKVLSATQYQVYRDGVGLGWLGNVDTYDDTGAGAPTITPGSADASDGTNIEYVALDLSGQSVSDGATHTYKVKAKNAAGESGYSATNTGYRGHDPLTYQWQRSAADSDADYSNIDGATAATYNDTGAPPNGDGRYYKCILNATGATQQTSSPDRGYRLTVVLPTVITHDATEITANSAKLWGEITGL